MWAALCMNIYTNMHNINIKGEGVAAGRCCRRGLICWFRFGILNRKPFRLAAYRLRVAHTHEWIMFPMHVHSNPSPYNMSITTGSSQQDRRDRQREQDRQDRQALAGQAVDSDRQAQAGQAVNRAASQDPPAPAAKLSFYIHAVHDREVILMHRLASTPLLEGRECGRRVRGGSRWEGLSAGEGVCAEGQG